MYGGMTQPQMPDMGEIQRNALARQTAELQQQQMRFNMMKAQTDFQYQQGQRAQAAAASAKDQAAETEATNAFLKTAQPGYTVNPDLSVPGAASDVGSVGSGMYPDLQGQRVAPTAPDMNATINQLRDAGKFDAAKKLMGQNQTFNANESSNIKLGEEKSKANGVDADTAAKAMAFHASQLPVVTQQSYSAWRDQTVKDLPNLDALLPKDAPQDPAQFEELKRSLILKAQDGVTKHYQTVTSGESTKTVGINPITQKAEDVPGTEGTTKPAKEAKSKLQQLHEYGDELRASLQKDPSNEGLKQQLAEVQDNINKEAKTPGDPNAPIPPNSKLFLEQTQKHEKDLRGVNGTIQKVDSTSKKIDTILDPKYDKAFNNLFGGYGAYATQHYTGDTAAIKGKLDSLKSDMKAAGLDIVRNKGGIGAMTEREWPIVQDMIDTLNPTMSADAARNVIAGIKGKLQNMAENDKSVYNGTWGQTQFHKKDYGYVPMGGQAGGAAPSGGPSVDDLVKMYSGKN